jgi:hypothetical protein
VRITAKKILGRFPIVVRVPHRVQFIDVVNHRSLNVPEACVVKSLFP